MPFDLEEILCRIYVPFVYWERFQIIPCLQQSSNLIILAFFLQMYVPQKILDVCNPGKCWDGQRTLDIVVGMTFFLYIFTHTHTITNENRTPTPKKFLEN